MDKHESVFLLMRAKDGRKRPSRKTVPVCKGELIQEFPQPLPADQHSREHNFHVLNDPSITLWCDPTDVAPVVGSECHYLLAVSPGHRIKEFNNRDKKEYVMKLITGNEVSFRTNESRLVKGRIRYVGPVQGKIGVYLGVEIDQDDEYRGFGTTGLPYFDCGRNNAVWLSMDMVVYPPPTTGQHVPHGNTSNGKSSAGTKHPGQNTGKHEGQQMPSDDSTGNNSTVQNTTTESNKSSRQGGIIGNVASKVWNFFGKDQPQYPTSKLYKEGDRVVLYSMKAEQFIGATVRWTGQVQLSKESAMPLAMVVGLETDRLLNASEEFPEVYVDIEDQRWAKFNVERGHGKVYLPEQMLLMEAEYLRQKSMEQKQIAKELEVSYSQFTAGELKGVGFKEQQQRFDEAKAEHERKLKAKREHNHVDLSAVTAEDIEEQQAKLKEFEEKKRKNYLQNTIDKAEAAHEQILEKKLVSAPQAESHTMTLLEEKTQEIAQLKKEITSFQRENSSCQSEITHLQAEITHLKDMNSFKLAEATQNMVHLQKDNDYWQGEVTRLQKDNNYWQREVASLQEEVRQLQSRLERQPKLGTDSDISFWLVNHEEIHSTGKVLGEGAWGKVTIGHYRGQNVAIKQLHSAIKSDFFDKLLRREISVMAKVRHPNLLLFIAAVLDAPSGSPIIITELLDTSLRHAYTSGQLTNKRVKVSILRDVAAALNYLHLQREPIIHRDVSSANVLLLALPDNCWRGKLSDFGSANLARYATTPGAGALVYSAPEAFARGQQSPKIDVYSYGKLFCEVYTSKFPDPDAFPSLLQSVAREWPIIHQTITACVEDDPSNRPTMSSIVDQLNVFTR